MNTTFYEVDNSTFSQESDIQTNDTLSETQLSVISDQVKVIQTETPQVSDPTPTSNSYQHIHPNITNLIFHSSDTTNSVPHSYNTSHWSRLPRDNSTRTPYNDIYRNIYSPRRTPKPGEFKFKQYHKLKYYVGSKPDTELRDRTQLPKTDHFDVTIISQTT